MLVAYPVALDYGMRAIAEAMKAVAEPCGPATIEQYYVFNDQDSSRTGHHWFTVCLRVTRRVGENENTSPEAERAVAGAVAAAVGEEAGSDGTVPRAVAEAASVAGSFTTRRWIPDV